MAGEARRPGPLLGLIVAHGPAIGNGHLGRGLALAGAWVATGGRARIVDDGLPPDWAERYRTAGVDVVDQAWFDGESAAVYVVDGYELPVALPTDLRRRGRVLVVDDDGQRAGLGTYDADWILDQNLGADSSPYGDRAAGCRLLLGSSFALLRTDVVAHRPAQRPDRRVSPRRLLLAMGGDPAPELRSLLGAVADQATARWGLTVVPLQGTTEVGAVLAGVDLAVTAAGSTVWELGAHGVPAVAVVVAANQRTLARRAAIADVVERGGELGAISADDLVRSLAALVAHPARRDELSANAWAAVDGRGARRVVVALRAGLLELRPAAPGDVDVLFAWINDPDVRAAAHDPSAVAIESHRAWFADRLASPTSSIWMVSEPGGVPVGQVRLELDGDGRGLLSYSVAQEQRGRGLAAPMLAAANDAAFATRSVGELDEVVAEVLVANEASSRALRSAGFRQGDDGQLGDRRWHTYLAVRPAGSPAT